MSVSYKRLWHLLIDKDMKKKDLMEKANISDYTIRKLNRGDNVTTDVLVRICHALDCHIEDIMEVLPEDKASFVEAERRAGRTVIMIGDGINDSPALSAANVGIAISDGAAIAREIADVTIAAESLFELVALRRIAQHLMRRIHANYRFVIGFNGSLIGLGVAGILMPATSAMLHNLSTVAISLRSMTNLMPAGDAEKPVK